MNNNLLITGLTGAKLGFQLLSTIIVTRILTPDAFALVGLTGSIVFLSELLSDTGTRSLILRHKASDSQNFLNNLWTFALIRSVFLFFLVLFFAHPLANWMAMPDLELALYIASPSFIFRGARSLAPFIQDRRNKPAKPMLTDFASRIIGIILTVATTVIFKSKWCIVIGMLYPSIIYLICSYFLFSQERIRLAFDKSIYLEIFHWAKFIVPSSLITVLLVQSDKLVFGKLLSADKLGFYYLAFNLARIPAQFIIQYANKIIGPAVSSAIHSNQGDLADLYYGAKNRMLLLVGIGVGVFAGFTDTLIGIIYDDRYAEVALFLSILLIRPALHIFSHPLIVPLVICGRVKTVLVANMLRLTWVILLSVPVYFEFGIIGIVAVYATYDIPAVVYAGWVAHKEDLYNYKKEFGYLVVVLCSFYASGLLQTMLHETSRL